MSAASEQRPRLYALLRRWPTVLGVGGRSVTLSDFDDGREFAIVLLIASVGYLAIAVLERPRATWWGSHRPTCGRCLFASAQCRPWAGARGGRRRGYDDRRAGAWFAASTLLPALQAPATPAIFGAVAFIAIAAGSQVVEHLWLQWGLLAHTVWDLVHLRARAIVSPRWPSGAQYWIP